MADRLSPLESKAELSRRQALKLLASAVAAVQACVEPPGDIVRPYARQPANVIPGQPRWFATSMVLDGLATGLIVESHEGRPTKIEGNPEHPASLGGTLAQHQASVLDLYDPSRAQAVTRGGVASSWRALMEQLAHAPGPWWLVLPESSSPLEAALLEALVVKRPDLRVVRHGAQSYEGARMAFGAPYETQLDFTRARTVLSLDADLFALHAHAPRWARDFAAQKRAGKVRGYVVEPMITPTGALADRRLALRAGDLPAFALALAAELRRRGLAVPSLPAPTIAQSFVRAVADDLMRGDGLIAVGDRQPAPVHALAHALNRALNAPVTLTAPARNAVPNEASWQELAAAAPGTLLILDCNPGYSGLADVVRRAQLSVHFDRHFNETSAASHWHAPLSHYLESWGDARARDGTLSIVQPLIRPLHDTRTSAEVLAMLGGDLHAQGYRLLRSQLRDESRWDALLTHGFDARSAFPAVTPALREFSVRHEPTSGIELALNRSPTLFDERFANNAWLQELPHPRTKQTWGNALLMGTPLAAELGVDTGSLVRVERDGRALEVPAFIIPEHAPNAVTLEVGYGRVAASERMAHKVGVNAALLGGPIAAVKLTATGKRETLACTQNELDQHGRELAPMLTANALAKDPLREKREKPASTQPVKPSSGPQWAMTIDTNLCSGCGACVVACQSENNIPVVGKRELTRGREMHWLRIDTYLSPEGLVNQPMMCQHCEHAPCEYVCPVFATEHSPDGLNEMTYQRCIGTRFCSQNCPYKVRRFNWLHYSDDDDKLALQKNPEVTVRGRGVMEKCTYCVQRIRHAEHQARMEKRNIRHGEVVSACQQACPTNAIQFGMVEEMQELRESPRAYGVLSELGTRPRTMYLAKLTEEPT